MDAVHHHDSDHGHQEGGMSVIGRAVMLVAVLGGYFLIRTLLASHVIGLPQWAVTLILASCGILIAGSSVVNLEEKGGAKIAGYVGFALTAVSILLMFDGWIFHAGGTK